MTKPIDVMGQRFGRLVVSGPSDRKSPAGKLWVCACECGGEAVTTSLKLRSGHTTSCGCIRKEVVSGRSTTHGMSKTRTYKSWKEMHRRCRSETCDQWKWYGGMGIRVCDEWASFDAFISDMGERPANTTLDRLDSDGDYSLKNCRWATPKQQAETNRGVIRRGEAPPNKTPQMTIDSIRSSVLEGASVSDAARSNFVGYHVAWSHTRDIRSK